MFFPPVYDRMRYHFNDIGCCLSSDYQSSQTLSINIHIVQLLHIIQYINSLSQVSFTIILLIYISEIDYKIFYNYSLNNNKNIYLIEIYLFECVQFILFNIINLI